MTDLYVVDGEGLVLPHGSIVTQVTVNGSGRRRNRQMELIKELSWQYGCVVQTPGGVSFLVYVRPEADGNENRAVSDFLLSLNDRGAFLTETIADRVLDPAYGPYPHTDERLMHAVRDGTITADGFAVRLFFTSERHGETILFYAVRESIETAMRTVQHIERPCMGCLKPYRNALPFDSEFVMADVVPFVLLPF